MITDIKEYLRYLNYKQCVVTEHILQEGLIKTYNPDFVYRKLRKDLKNYNHEIVAYKEDLQFIDKSILDVNDYKFVMEIIIRQKISVSELVNIQKNINLCGYFISVIFLDDKKFILVDDCIKNLDIDYDEMFIVIDAKFDASIDLSKLHTEYIYHIGDIKYKDKIKTIGLIPRNKSKLSNHLDRIYFETDINNIYDLAKQLYPDDKYIIFKVKMVDIQNIKFYIDPNYSTGICTFENIAPNIIKKL